jgi:hypothetical protein
MLRPRSSSRKARINCLPFGIARLSVHVKIDAGIVHAPPQVHFEMCGSRTKRYY